MAQKRSLSPFQPAIDRMKAIVAVSGDHLLLADGPPHPDAALLDLCSEALHHLKEAEKVYRSRLPTPVHGSSSSADWQEWHRDDGERMALYYKHLGLARRPMSRAKKVRATTPAGIYAKALCVQASRTGAAEFAVSLAEDLVNNPTLRASLWPAEHGGPDHAAA